MVNIEKVVEKSLNYIDILIKDGLYTIKNQTLTNKINEINDYLKDYNHLLVTLLVLFIFYLLFQFLKNSTKLFEISTYSYYFFKVFGQFNFIKKEMLKERKSLTTFVAESIDSHRYDAKYSIQENGLSADKVISLLKDLSKGDKTDPLSVSRKTGCVYAKNYDYDEICAVAAELYSNVDLNHPDTCPSVKKMEKNISDFMLKLFNNEKYGEALLTSGGTDSILTACLAAKNFAKKNNISKPNMIANVKIHPAFDKGAEVFGIDLIKIPLNSDWTMDLGKLKSAVNENTVMIIACAIDYPHGLIDDTKYMSDLAIEKNILYHIDGCMGGFITCFFDDYKINFPPCDFRLPGITSISCDVHKYGMTPKGCSVIMFKNKEIKNLIGFGMVGNDGLYINSSALNCSRNAYLVAASFAILIKNGRKLYSNQSKRISTALLDITSKIRKDFPKLKVIGKPESSIFAFTGSKIGQIHNEMKKKNWTINLVADPIACMFCMTSENVKSIEDGSFEKDLKECYDECYIKNITKQSSLAAMYGVAANLPESVLNANMDVVLDCFLDSKEYINSITPKTK